MEACAGSHFWGRRLSGLGFEVTLLPPHYVRAYVRRNKTDRTDCEALLAAQRKRKTGRTLSYLEQWGLELAKQKPHNQAAVAVANKMARVIWAAWYHDRSFETQPARKAA